MTSRTSPPLNVSAAFDSRSRSEISRWRGSSEVKSKISSSSFEIGVRSGPSSPIRSRTGLRFSVEGLVW